MHPINTEPVSFTPDYYKNADGAPIYTLAPIGESERLSALARVTQRMGKQVSDSEIDDVLLQGLRVVLEPDEAGRAESALEELAALRRIAGNLDIDQAERCAELLLERQRLERLVSDEWFIERRGEQQNPFNRLLARAQEQEERTWLEYTLVAVRDWSGDSLPPYERRAGRVPEAVFDQLPFKDRTALKTQTVFLSVGLTKAILGNSARPSSAGSSPETSRVAASVPTQEAGSIH